MKKILFAGFILVLFAAIPITVFFLQQRTQTKSNATASTTLSFNPSSSIATVGQPFTLDIMVDPGTGTTANQLSSVKLSISYDQNLLTTTESSLVPDVNYTVLDGPLYTPGNISIDLGVSSNSTSVDLSKIIQSAFKIATVTFVPLNPTIGTTTQVLFDQKTFARSTNCDQSNITDQGKCPDSPSENVISGKSPAQITINAQVVDSPTPTPTATAVAPICRTFTTTSPSGQAPLTTTFAITGDTTDGTISKITLNYGDSGNGSVVENTDTANGIGTTSVNAQMSYTYNVGGTYTASAILTGSNGTTSEPTNCSQTITVTANTEPTATPTATLPTTTPTPIPERPVTGPGTTLLTIGAIGGILMAFGGFLLFGL